MSAYFTYRMTRFASNFATISFIVGTLLFLFFLATTSALVKGIGIVFFSLFMCLNFLTLWLTLINGLLQRKAFEQFIVAILLTLLNGLIILGYLWLAVQFV